MRSAPPRRRSRETCQDGRRCDSVRRAAAGGKHDLATQWTIPRRIDQSHWRALAIAAFVVLCGITSARAHEADGHPACIYHGSCSSLGEIAFPLTGVGAHVTTAGTPVAATQTMGSE